MLMKHAFYRESIHQAIEGTIQALQPDALDWPIMRFQGAGTEEDPMYVNRAPMDNEIDDFLEDGITHIIVAGKLYVMTPDK